MSAIEKTSWSVSDLPFCLMSAKYSNLLDWDLEGSWQFMPHEM